MVADKVVVAFHLVGRYAVVDAFAIIPSESTAVPAMCPGGTACRLLLGFAAFGTRTFAIVALAVATVVAFHLRKHSPDTSANGVGQSTTTF
jgi:hypothetical protein